MNKRVLSFAMGLLVITGACSPEAPNGFVLVEGGKFIDTKSKYHNSKENISDFYISKTEVSQREWAEVMNSNPAVFKGDSLPVENVSWYDCVDYCNARSKKEGLTPYYTIDKTAKTRSENSHDSINWTVNTNDGANGYRLPTEAEWEYAASGGQQSRSYTYSGSNTVEDVGWFWQNAGDNYLTATWSWELLAKNHNRPRPVGRKAANELGLYDMSGNVREWCWDWHAPSGPEDFPGRVWKGGGWIGANFCCEPSFSASYEANGKGPDQGFRVCRSK